LTATALKLRYRSNDQARAHYHQLKTGCMFIPSEMPLPVQTRLRLTLILPEERQSIAFQAEVLKSVDPKAAAASKKATGMFLGLVGDNQTAIQNIEQQLGLMSGAGSAAPSEPAAPSPDTRPPPPPVKKH
jgi:Tfp pilus assembly protein PilZ